MKESLPTYDICSIDRESVDKDLLIEGFSDYLKKHYSNLQRPHRHSFYHLVLFTEGKGWHTIDFERFKVLPFQIYFMVPGQVHSWHFSGKVDGYIIHFNESFISTFLHNTHYLEKFSFFGGSPSESICNIPADAQRDVVKLFRDMLGERDEKKPNLDLIRLHLLELFIKVDRVCNSQQKKALPQQKSILLNNFRKLIDRNFRTLKLPKEYAEHLYVTPNHLNALCQEMLGKTAGDLIRERVLLEAKRLLTNADLTVSQIAYDLNFQDNSYFNRFFKKSEGVTPEAFRKNFLEQ